MRYKSDYNSIEIKNKLNDLIENHSEDKLSNHFRNIITKEINMVSGNVVDNNFMIWRYDYICSGMFYSVIFGKIIDNGESCFIEMHAKLNRFTLVLIMVISFIIGYIILTEIIIQNDNYFKFLLRRFLIGGVLFLLFQTVPLIVYFGSKKRTVKMLVEKMKLTKNMC